MWTTEVYLECITVKIIFSCYKIANYSFHELQYFVLSKPLLDDAALPKECTIDNARLVLWAVQTSLLQTCYTQGYT